MVKLFFNLLFLSTSALCGPSFANNYMYIGHDEQESSNLNKLLNHMISDIFNYLDFHELSKAKELSHQLKTVSEKLQEIKEREIFLNIKNNTGTAIKLKFSINLTNQFTKQNRIVQAYSGYKNLEKNQILTLTKSDVDNMVRNDKHFKYQLDKFSPNDFFVGSNLDGIIVKDIKTYGINIYGILLGSKKIIDICS